MTEKKIKKEPIDWRIVAAAIFSLTILEAIAILKGINGTLFSLVAAIIAGLAGLSLPQLKLRGH